MGQARYSVHYALAALLLTGCAPKQTAAPQSSIASAQLANAGPDRPEPIDLVLSEFAITPSHVRLRTDHAYRLHLENRGSSGHSLSAPEFFRAAAPREGPGAADATSSGGIEVAPGASKDIYLHPRRAGTFPMECSHFLHPSFGMSGDIVVE